MGRPYEITGYKQAVYLAKCLMRIDAADDRMNAALRSGATSAIPYVQAIGDARALLKEAVKTGILAQGTLERNDIPTDKEELIALFRQILAELEQE